MKKDKIIFWITTGLLGLMMIFSAFSYFTNPEVKKGFQHLGFPDYFRIELAIAKLAGAILLLVPAVPARLKELAYIGFGITFVSAAIAHLSSGDPATVVIGPLIAIVLLITSYLYHHKLLKQIHQPVFSK